MAGEPGAVTSSELRGAVLHRMDRDMQVAEAARHEDVLAMVDRVGRRPDAPLAPEQRRWLFEALDRAHRKLPTVAMLVAVGLVLTGLCAIMGWPLERREPSRYACPRPHQTIRVLPSEASLAFRNDTAGDTDAVGVARITPGSYTRDGLAQALARALSLEQERLAVLHRTVAVGGIDTEQVPPEVVAEAVGGLRAAPDGGGRRYLVEMRSRQDAEATVGYAEIRRQLRPVRLVEPDPLEPFECTYLCRPGGAGEALYVGKATESFSLLLGDGQGLAQRFVERADLTGRSEYLVAFEWGAALPDPHGSLLVVNSTPEPLRLQAVPDIGEFGRPGSSAGCCPARACAPRACGPGPPAARPSPGRQPLLTPAARGTLGEGAAAPGRRPLAGLRRRGGGGGGPGGGRRSPRRTSCGGG